MRSTGETYAPTVDRVEFIFAADGALDCCEECFEHDGFEDRRSYERDGETRYRKKCDWCGKRNRSAVDRDAHLRGTHRDRDRDRDGVPKPWWWLRFYPPELRDQMKELVENPRRLSYSERRRLWWKTEPRRMGVDRSGHQQLPVWYGHDADLHSDDDPPIPKNRERPSAEPEFDPPMFVPAPDAKAPGSHERPAYGGEDWTKPQKWLFGVTTNTELPPSVTKRPC